MTEAASTVTAKAIDGMSNAGHVLKNRQVKLVDGRIYIADKPWRKATTIKVD